MKIREIAVISGKGGTGKTTVTASLIPYLEKTVIADCDVDAPDLHILLKPERREIQSFSGSAKARIKGDLCRNCGVCFDHCRFKAVIRDIGTIINKMKCEGCGVCQYVCPAGAITLEDVQTGSIYRGLTPYGPMVGARLIPGEETSGKLVSMVRAKAVETAAERGWERVIIDGSPGIGCNVISSLTGAETIIVVTEPTRSAIHDLERVLQVAERFAENIHLIINKCDLSDELSLQIERLAKRRNIPVPLKIPFDKRMVRAVTERVIPSLAEERFFETIGWKDFAREITGEKI